MAVTAAAVLAGCGGADGGSGAEGGVLKLWTHNAGNAAEYDVVEKVVKDFNASQTTYKVEIEAFPQGSYNDAVVASSSSKKLPCILDVDGPNVPNWAWGGYLAPLELSGGEVPLDAQLPSTVGKYQDKVYAFGFYDVALTMFARKSVLDEHGIRIPTWDEPWTRAEFSEALADLKAGGKFEHPLEMGTGGSGEWWPYAYSPQLQSFGGDLVDRSSYQTAEGALNGPEALDWAKWFRSLVTDGYMAQKSGSSPNDDFLNGKSAIEWDGSWDAAKNVDKLGDDLLILPPVDFGKGPKIGGASWQWAMSSNCAKPEGARAFLEFTRKTAYFTEFAKATGTIPATAAASAQIPGYEPGGRYEPLVRSARDFAVVRPVTPAYPFIASVFEKTAKDVVAGADPKSALDEAVKQIDANLKQNNFYAD
ncbi:extracellular solute-binding protein [Saccharothrix hoggarensis]|uniref:Extracellular solute-binding protein n=1 Tax=Saccharothrix hoggarensis TaxID=913853 RepID=A0ABW3QV57_9PSEU